MIAAPTKPISRAAGRPADLTHLRGDRPSCATGGRLAGLLATRRARCNSSRLRAMTDFALFSENARCLITPDTPGRLTPGGAALKSGTFRPLTELCLHARDFTNSDLFLGKPRRIPALTPP